jgi:FkbM family methyltransferase
VAKLLQILMYILLYTPLVSFVYGNSADFQQNFKSLQYNLVDGLPDVYLHPNSEKIGQTWINGTVWEKHLIQKFYSLLPKNDFFVVIDLGAQTGCFSLLAQYFPNSAWYAFEPIQEAADTLKANLALNGIHNVTVHQKAVMDFSGQITLKMPAMNLWGLSTVGSHVKRKEFGPVIEERVVECTDLDSFVDNHKIRKVHFIKIDTEGSELSILRGARKMIMSDHPIILIEYNEINMSQCDVNRQDIDSLLKEMGYTWELISSEDILCIPQ